MLASNLHDNGLSPFIRTWNPNSFTWQPIAATSGNDTAFTASTAFVGQVRIEGNCQITGIQLLVGATGGTDKWLVTLNDENGVLLANSALAGVTATTNGTVQQIPFTSLYIAAGPRYLLFSVVSNGTTATLRTIPAACSLSGVQCGTVAQTFGAPANFTAPTGFTANTCPVGGIY